MKRSSNILLLVILAAVAAGCTHVRPWDRDHLANYTMRPDRDPLTSAVNEHLWFSREATYGGRGVGGGGCGCN